MAGHSQFKNIMYRKGAQDKKRARLFARLGRELMVAARQGLPDPEFNPRLRAAMAAARGANMPRDNIERAIRRASGAEGDTHYEEVRYEGFGPGGVAIIVEALTDNRNRTASELRSAFSKHGGSLAETGAVSFMFARTGLIHYPLAAGTPEKVFEAALEAGASDVASGEGGHDITCAPDDLAQVRDALEAVLGEPQSAALDWRPQSVVPVADEAAQTLFKLLDVLDDSDEVQRVAANYDVPEEALKSLSA